MKKFALLGGNHVYIESNLALIMINAHNFGSLENLVILKADSEICKKIDPTNQYTIILDKSKNYMSDHLEILKVEEDDIEYEYLFYISQYELDGSRKVPEEDVSNCCNQPVIENTDLCSDCKEHTEVINVIDNNKKDKWKSELNIKNHIASVSNVCLATFDIIEDNDDAGLISFLADNGIHSFKKAVTIIKEFLDPYGYTLLHKSNVYVDFDNINRTEELSDGVGKFFIIKNEEKFLREKTVKPISVYASKDDIGYIIGNQGTKIKRLVRDFNLINKKWVVPYIKVSPIEDRVTNNSYVELKNKYYELLKIIFKNKINKG